jgi:phosphoribosylformylglycinamidine cyclo-ligase
MAIDDKIDETGTTVAESLMAIHRSYLNIVAPLLEKDMIKGIAHITGGGFEGNINRIMPDGLTAVVDSNSWRTPGIFETISRLGNISKKEMYRVFNMGVGMVLICDKNNGEEIINKADAGNIDAFNIGHVETGNEKVILKF